MGSPWATRCPFIPPRLPHGPCPALPQLAALLLHPGTAPKRSTRFSSPGSGGCLGFPSPPQPTQSSLRRAGWLPARTGCGYSVQQSRVSQTGGKSSESPFLFRQQPPKSSRLAGSWPRLESPSWRLDIVETRGLRQATARSARLSCWEQCLQLLWTIVWWATPMPCPPFLKGNGAQHRLACLFSCSPWKEQHACPHGCQWAVPAGCC